MNLYYASAFSNARHVDALAADVATRGEHTSVSRWHVDVPVGAADPSSSRARRRILDDNLVDIRLADVMVVLASVGTPRATYCEAGFALAHRIPIVWVHGLAGTGRCIVDAHPLVTRLASDAIDGVPLARRIVRALRMAGS